MSRKGHVTCQAVGKADFSTPEACGGQGEAEGQCYLLCGRWCTRDMDDLRSLMDPFSRDDHNHFNSHTLHPAPMPILTMGSDLSVRTPHLGKGCS